MFNNDHYGETLRRLADFPRRDIVAGMRDLGRWRTMPIRLNGVRAIDLHALSSVWKCVATDKVVIDATNMRDPDTRDNVLRAAAMLTAGCTNTKTMIEIDRAFIERRDAAFFKDTIFDSVVICDAGEIDGAGMPRCRHFVFDNLNGGYIKMGDADDFAPFVEKLNTGVGYRGISMYKSLSPRKCYVYFGSDERLRDVSELFPRVEQLNIIFSRMPDASAIEHITRFRSLRRVRLSFGFTMQGEIPMDFLDSIAALPMLRYLAIHWNRAVKGDFLLKMPKLEHLEISLGRPTWRLASYAQFLPRLRTLRLRTQDALREEVEKRTRVSEMREFFVSRTLGVHASIARVLSSQVSELVYLMTMPTEQHLVLRDIIRDPPVCRMLDGQWDKKN